MACAAYLDYHPNIIWCHVANERNTSVIKGARLKKKGVKSGVPDVLIFNQTKLYNGLAIELKIKPNRPTKNQNQWLSDLSSNNWRCEVVYTLDDFIEVVEGYLKN